MGPLEEHLQAVDLDTEALHVVNARVNELTVEYDWLHNGLRGQR